MVMPFASGKINYNFRETIRNYFLKKRLFLTAMTNGMKSLL